ncbi:hypothetical protein C922_03450 [Plasmodium inui San Antonio 1]|uniref:Uncharacterized protein n=1 Tax=Plasmodium inui San Antonio 1 TaxID=1237626 RepID=W7A3N2_9APIC|nr:hypothetical protein C922_03450 [Plasmodium inui San Antonio 1]EUD66255.1 hypothetical protein C922_03450 [Plasmodium inui San Antonio 1]
MEEEDDTKQTLFRRKRKQRKRDGCRICRKKYRKCLNTCLTWEVVLLMVHILVFLIIIFKWVKDGKLDQVDKKLFRTYKSGCHFMQGILFVLLIVPFRFNKRVVKWIYNFAIKNETPMDDECRQKPYPNPYGDIEQNKMGDYLSNEEGDDSWVSEKGRKRDSAMHSAFGSFYDKNRDHREVGGGVVSDGAAGNQTVDNQTVDNQTVDNQTVVEHFADARGMDTSGMDTSHMDGSEMDTGEMDTGEMETNQMNGQEQFSRVGRTNTPRGGEGIGHQKGNVGKDTSGERLTMNRRRKGSGSSGSLRREHTKRKVPLCESFVNSLVFPVNTPKHTKEKIQYFFLCAKLYTNKRSSFLFFLKYVSSFILMFGYPLYNLVKRKVLHRYFYFTSYYMNAFDFASGLLLGSLFVLVYGVVKFFSSLYMNRKNSKFYFFDNYPFMGEVKCLCDQNVRIIIHNNPHLKPMAIQYLNSYGIYKSFLLIGLFILFVLCIFSFVFSLNSMSAHVPVAG